MPRGKSGGKGAKGKGGKGKGGKGKGGKGGKRDGMEVDGGASYVGYYQDDWGCDYASHFPMFAGNLGMLSNLDAIAANSKAVAINFQEAVMKKKRSAEMDDQVMGAAPQPRPLPSITVADLNPKDEQ